MSGNAANIEWRQNEDDDSSLEINVPVILPTGSRAKEITVDVADGEIIVVKHKDVKLWQCRLHAPVDDEVEWHVENESVIVLDITKKSSDRWPALLNLPLKTTDSHFFTATELDAVIQKELPSLPPVGQEGAATADKDDAVSSEAVSSDAEAETEVEAEVKAASDADDSDDLDKLLDDAADELAGKPVAEKKDEKEEEIEEDAEAVNLHTEAELKGMAEETKAILGKMEELTAELKNAEVGSEEHTTIQKHLEITGRMLELGRRARFLRGQPMTVKGFLEIQRLDIAKARCNIGELSDNETEEYQSEEEKGMTGQELFMNGIRMLEIDPATGVHLLRLSAIHKAHGPSAVALFSIYTNVPASFVRGAIILVNDASRDENMEMRTNSKVADMFNAGTRHFPPLWSMAIHFHQRAASLGSTHSIVNLAALHMAGECTGDSMMDAKLKKTNQDPAKANYFVQSAVDRGSVAGYLIRASQLAKGEHGINKDIAEAKKFFGRACMAEPTIKGSGDLSIAGGMTIAELKVIIGEDDAPKKTPVGDDDLDDMRPSLQGPGTMTTASAPSAQDRLAALEAAAPAAGSPMMGMGMGGKKAGGGGIGASGAKARSMWEGATRWGVTAFAFYTVVFPLRVIMLPFFYEQLQGLIGMFGGDGQKTLF